MTQPPSTSPAPQSRGSQGTVVVEGMSFQGPLPHPALLEHYNKIVPGAADRIIKMAENQANHRQKLEKRVISTNSITSVAGQVIGLIIGLRAFAFATEALRQGQTSTAIVTIMMTITSLVGVFVYGKSQNTKQLRQRAEQEQ